MFKNIYTPVVAILISGVIVYFVALPDFGALKKAKAELATKKATLEKMKKVGELVKEKNADYKKNFLVKRIKKDGKVVKDESDKFFQQKEIFPLIVKKQIDDIRLLINIYGLANETTENGHYVSAGEFGDVSLPGKDSGDGMSADTSGFDGEEGAQNLTSDKLLDKGEVTFTFSATYDDFQKFLQRVEKNANLLDVVKISFANSEGGEDGSGGEGEESSDNGEVKSSAAKEVDENTIYDFEVTFRTYQLAN